MYLLMGMPSADRAFGVGPGSEKRLDIVLGEPHSFLNHIVEDHPCDFMVAVISHQHISARGFLQQGHIFERNAVAGSRRVCHPCSEILDIRLADVQMDAVLLAVLQNDVLEQNVGNMAAGTVVYAEPTAGKRIIGSTAGAVYALTIPVCDTGNVLVGLGADDE